MNENLTTEFRLGKVRANDALALPLGQRNALHSAGEAFHALANTMPQMVWSTLPDGSHDYYNARWYEFTGAPHGSTDGEGWAGMFHEDDQPCALEKWQHSLASGEPYEVEYRLRHHSGEYRWMIGRALPIRDEAGCIQRWIGTCTDIDDQKQIALQNEVLSEELSHRIKNIFAIVSGLISMTARANETFRIGAKDLLSRISALGRAHEFVRPHSKKSLPEAEDVNLTTLLAMILEAYPAYHEGRLSISGQQVGVDSRSATPVALVFHELATNAMKYGALSVPDGEVTLQISSDEENVIFHWKEYGAQVNEDVQPEQGFGSRLIDLAIRQQLGGSYERFWKAEGVEMFMTVRRSRLEKARR